MLGQHEYLSLDLVQVVRVIRYAGMVCLHPQSWATQTIIEMQLTKITVECILPETAA